MAQITLDPNWPGLQDGVEPPSLDDQQSAPTADDILPQLLALTPRGTAWGTDEAAYAGNVAPVMRQFWRAIAAWIADLNARDFDVMLQSIPTAITWTLDSWEAELGLAPLADATAPRLAWVRMHLRGLDGPDPAAILILLKTCARVEATIEEPEQFMCDVTPLGPSFDAPPAAPSDLEAMHQIVDEAAWKYWILTVIDPGDLLNKTLVERALAPFVPVHTKLVVI